jgi:hypothetical protein
MKVSVVLVILCSVRMLYYAFAWVELYSKRALTCLEQLLSVRQHLIQSQHQAVNVVFWPLQVAKGGSVLHNPAVFGQVCRYYCEHHYRKLLMCLYFLYVSNLYRAVARCSSQAAVCIVLY